MATRPRSRITAPGLDFTREQALYAQPVLDPLHAPIAGADEVGRGPLAGPVVAAAVILDPAHVPQGLADSKKLSARRRDILYAEICAHADIGIALAPPARIDRDNIRQATLWALAQAIAALPRAPALVLVDGNDPPPAACRVETIVGGDNLVASIAAASIVAKVVRDRLMTRLGAQFPAYGFERHMGYGTPAHLAALRAHGPCPHHRHSFAPVRQKTLLLDE
ncbi:ribonuclease HII [Xanthobacter sp. TB0136]|uniref:ribonuclease HII n=1 Tax=Xanthobacter sp. TB0136 TaxID=3459177 RepID=UPI004039649F